MKQCLEIHNATGVDPNVQAAVDAVVGQLHLQAHAIFKPDELARERTTRLYRVAHPPADRAAEAIPIYPTNAAQIARLLRKEK